MNTTVRTTKVRNRDALFRCVSRSVWAPLLAVTSLALFGQHSYAQNYPTRDVTVVVPYAAGGGTDILARLIGQKLEKRLGKPIIVENRPGAGTVIAAVGLVSAAPDGHTLMMATSSTMSINVTLYKKLPYNPATQLTPVSLVCTLPFVLVVNPSLPVKNAADLIKFIKDHPGQLNFGSGGAGSANHLFMELFKTMTGTNIAHVPYKGSTPALNDVVAGHIQLMLSEIAPALPLIRAGKLRAIGVTSGEPVAAAPDIPPLAKTVSGYDPVSWQMLIAPAGTPAGIVAKLNQEINGIVNEPDVSKKFTELGLVPIGKETPGELAQFVKAETVRWSKVVQDAGAAGSE
jgi:tripartite-type tricarboxylate transporter receptor subunit TctC